MTSSKAYAIFPRPTFIQYKTYALNILNRVCWSTLAKYTQRGWRIQDVLWEEEESPYHSIRKLRCIGDFSTWKIPFDMTDVKKSSVPDEILERAQFGVYQSNDAHPDTDWNYTIKTEIFSAFTLRYQYIFAENDSDFWNIIVEERIDRLTSMERMKLDEKSRVSFDARVTIARENHDSVKAFDAPNTWTYYDDELPKWYKSWEDGGRKKGINIREYKDSHLWKIEY